MIQTASSHYEGILYFRQIEVPECIADSFEDLVLRAIESRP